MDLVHQKTLLELNQKVNPKQGVVGWFSTYPVVTTADNLIHSFFASKYQTVSCLAPFPVIGRGARVRSVMGNDD